MSRLLKIFSLNVGKQRAVQHSVMNDTGLQDFGAIALSEPSCFIKEGKIVTVPLCHPYWTKMTPTSAREGRRAIGSMLWIRRDIESEQLPVCSPDITAALLQLPDRSILIASVYVEPANPQARLETIRMLEQVLCTTQARTSPQRMDVIITGDFNQHDQL